MFPIALQVCYIKSPYIHICSFHTEGKKHTFLGKFSLKRVIYFSSQKYPFGFVNISICIILLVIFLIKSINRWFKGLFNAKCEVKYFFSVFKIIFFNTFEVLARLMPFDLPNFIDEFRVLYFRWMCFEARFYYYLL